MQAGTNEGSSSNRPPPTASKYFNKATTTSTSTSSDAFDNILAANTDVLQGIGNARKAEEVATSGEPASGEFDAASSDALSALAPSTPPSAARSGHPYNSPLTSAPSAIASMSQPASPNTSLNIETTVAMFQRTSISDSIPAGSPESSVPVSEAVCTVSTPNAPLSGSLVSTPAVSHTVSRPLASSGGSLVSTVPMSHTLTTVSGPQAPPPSTGSSDDKLKQYFTSQSGPFESLSDPTKVDSAMMNPAYMSPTEGGFGVFSAAIPSPDSFLTPATEQDVFTASLLSSDADRRHDAWIPSQATKKALKAMETNPPGIYFPEKELLTMPGIAIKEDFVSNSS